MINNTQNPETTFLNTSGLQNRAPKQLSPDLTIWFRYSENFLLKKLLYLIQGMTQS
jgi:hypothetical protein